MEIVYDFCVFWQSTARDGDGGSHLRQARNFRECLAPSEQTVFRSPRGASQSLSTRRWHQADGSCAAPGTGAAFSFAPGAAFGPPFDTPTSAGRSTRSAIM
jgi:hypothetical protein